MSLDATRWAWTRTGIKSTDKLVLLSLADRADERHTCYPSISRLSADTCLDRKTVMDCISRLESGGLIQAEKRQGAGTQYRLVGVQDRYETSTEIGTGTKNGTSPKNGTAPVPKTVPLPVPKTGHESTNESTNNLKDTKRLRAPGFDSLAFVPETVNPAAWADWIDYLKARKKSPTEHTVKLQFKRLASHDHATQRAMIDQSIERGWLGLFEHKQQVGTRGRSIHEELTDRSWAQ